MEEHIGKRVNHERVEEALDTGASKIATGCPFCRVMMTDGVDDRAEAMGKEKAEVLDVAQLLLGVAGQEHRHAAAEGRGRGGRRRKRGDRPAEGRHRAGRSAAGRSRAGASRRPTPTSRPSRSPGWASPAGPSGPAPRRPPRQPADKPAAAAPAPPRDSASPPAPSGPARRRPPRPQSTTRRCPSRTRQGRADREGPGHRRRREATRREEDGRPPLKRPQPPKPPAAAAGIHRPRAADRAGTAGQGSGHRPGRATAGCQEDRGANATRGCTAAARRRFAEPQARARRRGQ